MKRIKVLPGILLLLLLFCSCAPVKGGGPGTNTTAAGPENQGSGSESPSTTTGEPVETERDPLRIQLDGMSVDEKIGQLLFFGFDGMAPDEQALDMISRYRPGGLIIMGANVESSSQLAKLVDALKAGTEKYGIPAFIGVDEEGGRVSRMPPELKDMPAALKVGKTGDPGHAEGMGRVIAEELKAFGFNMDFAPVLDIWSNPKNTVIGDRAFGTDPETVGKMGIPVMKGLADGGIIPVVKHFPGHGNTVADSHKELPVSDSGVERLKSFELKPFEEAVASGADAVMIAHILLEQVDDQYPASLSKAVITDLLRNQMGFDGVVITDDMTMGAIAKNYGLEEAAVKAVQAGCDLLLVVHGYDREAQVAESLKNAVQNGEISEERLDESVYRILRLKEKYGLTNTPVGAVDVKRLNSEIDRFLKN